ncbi:MAG: AbrB/MazE/SpoVT family DNA-binding domain-containing protein, partial [Halanaerobiales bacterium]
MKADLKLQTKVSKINNSGSVYVPSDVLRRFNIKKGQEMNIYIDFINQNKDICPPIVGFDLTQVM